MDSSDDDSSNELPDESARGATSWRSNSINERPDPLLYPTLEVVPRSGTPPAQLGRRRRSNSADFLATADGARTAAEFMAQFQFSGAAAAACMIR